MKEATRRLFASDETMATRGTPLREIASEQVWSDPQPDVAAPPAHKVDQALEQQIIQLLDSSAKPAENASAAFLRKEHELGALFWA